MTNVIDQNGQPIIIIGAIPMKRLDSTASVICGEEDREFYSLIGETEDGELQYLFDFQDLGVFRDLTVFSL